MRTEPSPQVSGGRNSVFSSPLMSSGILDRWKYLHNNQRLVNSCWVGSSLSSELAEIHCLLPFHYRSPKRNRMLYKPCATDEEISPKGQHSTWDHPGAMGQDTGSHQHPTPAPTSTSPVKML